MRQQPRKVPSEEDRLQANGQGTGIPVVKRREKRCRTQEGAKLPPKKREKNDFSALVVQRRKEKARRSVLAIKKKPLRSLRDRNQSGGKKTITRACGGNHKEKTSNDEEVKSSDSGRVDSIIQLKKRGKKIVQMLRDSRSRKGVCLL